MQVLINGEVWAGKPGFDTLTYDPEQVSLLPERWDLVDPHTYRRCLAAWPSGQRWMWEYVDVEATIVRATIVRRFGATSMDSAPTWWHMPADWKRKFDLG